MAMHGRKAGTMTTRITYLLMLMGMSAFAAATQPNILLILSDDHAKKAIGCHGNTDIKRPAIDRIAAEGMRFNQINKCGGAPACCVCQYGRIEGGGDRRTGEVGSYP